MLLIRKCKNWLIPTETISKIIFVDCNFNYGVFHLGQPLKHHCAIPICDLNWLQEFMTSSKLTLAQACYILRRTLFPFQHNPWAWVKGRGETTVEVLRSILVTYVFRMEVKKLKDMPEDPADFTCNLYQPELDDEGLEFVHHREDHSHLLKRIISCLREGLIPGVDTRYLRDALHDPSTGMTYESLTGKNKQSVPDCERIICSGVIAFLERKVMPVSTTQKPSTKQIKQLAFS